MMTTKFAQRAGFFLLLFFALMLRAESSKAYTTVYGGTTYSSAQPYNLDIYYFKANDVPLDPTYRKRISAMMFWLQNFYKQNMITNGYGPKTFGLWTSQAQPDSVRIIVINAPHNLDFYRSTTPGGNDSLINTVHAFRTANPAYITSAHSIILTATPSLNDCAGLPYYGSGRDCYAVDYPELDLQYLGQGGPNGSNFGPAFGGTAHELGHALNLTHSHQTTTENNDPGKGENLMALGNYSLTISPTFLNRAGCAVLSNNQLFSASPNPNFYNGHVAAITALHCTVTAGDSTMIISGRFRSDRPVTDVNFYQNPDTTGNLSSSGYYRVAFSVPPLGTQADSFWVSMPAREVLQNSYNYPATGGYNLDIDLVLGNGETAPESFLFHYNNGIPVGPTTFGGPCNPAPPGWLLADIGTTPTYPGEACWDAPTSTLAVRAWGNYMDGYTVDAMTYFYKPVASNDTITAQLITASYDLDDMAGLMIRADLTASSAYANISALNAWGMYSMWRDTAGHLSDYSNFTPQQMPVWLRMARTNDTVNSWYSADSVNWTLYDTRVLAFNGAAYMGLAVSGPGARGIFKNVRLSSGAPLAVTFRDVTVQAQGCNATVSWNTATEQKAAYFVIEQGADGHSFTEAGRVNSKNRITGSEYSFAPDALQNGMNYFRIKTVDIDGAYQYSKIVSVFSNCGAGQVSVSPNPAYNTLSVHGLTGIERLSVSDMAGRSLKEVQATASGAAIDLSDLAPGTYMMKVVNPSTGKSESLRIVKR